MGSKIIKKLEIEIDEAGLGSNWHGSKIELEKFAELYLNELVNEYPEIDEISVIPIIDSWNGAKSETIVYSVDENDNPILNDDGLPIEGELDMGDSDAWQNACDKSPEWWWLSEDKKIEKMVDFLTSLEIRVVKKRWNDETLTNSERQTLNRIRVKRENALKLKPRIAFFEQFDI